MQKVESYAEEYANELRELRKKVSDDFRAVGVNNELGKDPDLGAYGVVGYVNTRHIDLVENLFRKDDDESVMLIHAMMGITGEAGELTDAIKKHLFYGKDLDLENIMEEAGDLLFYITALLKLLGFNLTHAQACNHAKLSQRYPSGSFSTAQAVARADKAEPAVPSVHIGVGSQPK